MTSRFPSGAALRVLGALAVRTACGATASEPASEATSSKSGKLSEMARQEATPADLGALQTGIGAIKLEIEKATLEKLRR